MYVNILKYRQRRYLWWAVILLIASVAVYLSQDAALPPNGGSWQGYVLGTLGLLLIVWLAWLGIRKRSYRSQRGTLEGWVSAHVYLGLLVLPVAATLHAAFQFGYNLHTLAYLLMWGVVLSGLYGLYAYLRFPPAMVGNRGNQAFDERLEELERIDKKCLDTAAQCDETIHGVVDSAVDRTAVGGGLLDQLLARDRSQVLVPGTQAQSASALVPNRGQQTVIDYLVAKIPDTTKRGEAQRLQELLSLFGRRNELLRRLRRELSLQLRLKLWLCFHIPLTVGLLVALTAHVVTVFFYW